MNWPTALLEDLCDIEVGRTPARANPDFWGEGQPWLSIADMNQGRTITSTREQITAAAAMTGRQVAPGTVLLSFKLSIGKVAKAAIPLYTNEAIAALPIQRSDLLDANFLARYLEQANLSEDSNRAAMGATLTKAKLKTIRIPLPPLAQQRRIASILDHADALRTKRRQVLANFDTLTQSIFHDMFGDSSEPTAQLADVVAPGTIVTYGIVQAGAEFPEGVPYIRTGDIADGRILTDGLRRTDPAIASRFARSTVRSGDIVMSIRATVGTTAIVPLEIDGANLTQGTARIAPGPGVSSAYLLAHLRSETAQRWIQAQVKGATFREITLGRLRELAVPVPPLERQQEFARRASAVDGERAKAATALVEGNELFSSLQASAFSGAL